MRQQILKDQSYLDKNLEHTQPSKTAMTSISPKPLRFLDLPLELRQQIYTEYLRNCCQPTVEEIQEHVLPTKKLQPHPSLPNLLANLQIYEEDSDVLRREKRHTLRVTWREMTFDDVALSCFWARQERAHFDVQRLEVKIYPPHPDRPSDICYIYRYIKELSAQLLSFFCLPYLSITFLENNFGAWSRESTGLPSWHWPTSTIVMLIHIFVRLSNVAIAKINLPGSILWNGQLEELCLAAEKSMMNIISMRARELRWDVKWWEVLFDEVLEEKKRETGLLSKAKLEKRCRHH